MSTHIANHPAFVDPQGWSAAAQIMQAAGRDQCSDARTLLGVSISRTRTLVRALYMMMHDTPTPNMDDVFTMLDMVRDTVEDMGEDPLDFVEDFEISVNSAIYQNLTARTAAVEAAPAAPGEVPTQGFAEVLRTAIEGALGDHFEAQAKPAKAVKATKLKASVKGAA